MKRLLAGLIAAPAFIVTALVGATPASAEPLTPTTATTPAALLAELTVEAPSTIAYDRDRFQEGIDADGDGCNTRREVLQAESLVPVTISSGCTITAGEWFSWYEGVTHTDPAQLEMDHVVALKEAWVSGADAWTDSQRADYANDLDIDETLTMVTGSVNGAKSASDPAAWVPSLESSRCEYASDWVTVKYRWNLSVDETERAALANLISTYCGDHTIAVPAVREDTAPGTEAGGGVNPLGPGTHRLAGTDRYNTAVEISKRFNRGVDAVYIATGLNYPDALSAAAVAGARGVPLLLVMTDSVPPLVWDELDRLEPKEIVVIGGVTTVTDGVASRLSEIAPVRRIAGADRYETSQRVAQEGVERGGSNFIATGTNFPDALSSAAAAGFHGGRVVLVHGPDQAASVGTTVALQSLGTMHVQIAGSDASVSSGIEHSLRSRYTVQRYAGTDRFNTGALINRDNFYAPSTVYLALGTNFPDALAGGALAAATDAPLFIVQQNCIPEMAHDAITAWAPTTVVLLGSEASLGSGVWNLTKCAPPPPPPVVNPPAPGPGPWTPPAKPRDHNCSDFRTQQEAQQFLDYWKQWYGDFSNLDGDKDGRACESLPRG